MITIKKILKYIDEEIESAIEGIAENPMNSYGAGFEAGIVHAMQELKSFISECEHIEECICRKCLEDVLK